MDDFLLSNNAPDESNPLLERLAEQYKERAARADELAAALARVPAEIEDKDTAERVTSFIKQVKSEAKALEGLRVAEKEDFLKGARTVDAFFKRLADHLTSTAKALEERLNAYFRRLEQEERRRREEEARRAREAAEAAAAEARRVAMEEAKKAHELAEQRRREEDAREVERRAAEAERMAKIRTEQDMAAAIEADRQREKDERRRRLDALLQQEEEDKAREAAEKAAQEAAQTAADEALRREREAQAKAADLVRTRGTIGGVGTLRTRLDFEVDRGAVDLNTLRGFIKPEAVEQAIRLYASTQKGADLCATQPLKGVRFFRSQTAMVA